MERPVHSKKFILKELSKFQKINYNRFMWWRMYTYKTKPLPSKSDFREKIFNGDFDPSCYQLQAWLCEHELADLWDECIMDIAKFNEKGAVTKARRKRLLEDYEKDETYRLDYLFTEFSKNFDITKQQAKEEALKCSGEIIDLYYIIEDKYRKQIKVSRRGRPKKYV
jgi:hypothetical protein